MPPHPICPSSWVPLYSEQPAQLFLALNGFPGNPRTTSLRRSVLGHNVQVFPQGTVNPESHKGRKWRGVTVCVSKIAEPRACLLPSLPGNLLGGKQKCLVSIHISSQPEAVMKDLGITEDLGAFLLQGICTGSGSCRSWWRGSFPQACGFSVCF